MRNSLLFPLPSEISVGDYEEDGVKWLETKREAELAHAREVVVHSGYVLVRTLLGTCCEDLYWPIRRRQLAAGALRGSHACLVCGILQD